MVTSCPKMLSGLHVAAGMNPLYCVKCGGRLDGEEPNPYPPAAGREVTSQDAYQSVGDRRRESLRERVYRELEECNGTTADDLEMRLNLAGNTIRPRLKELEAQGRIRKSPRNSLTRAGRHAIVWEVVW